MTAELGGCVHLPELLPLSAQRLLSCGDAVNANWAIARPCFAAGLEAVQHYCFLQVTAPLAVRLRPDAVAGGKKEPSFKIHKPE